MSERCLQCSRSIRRGEQIERVERGPLHLGACQMDYLLEQSQDFTDEDWACIEMGVPQAVYGGTIETAE